MKKRRLILSILLLLFGFIFNSCDKLLGDKTLSDNNKYVKRIDKIKDATISTIEIDFYIDQYGNNFASEILPLKDETEYGVDLYTMVYETEFNGKKIEASGAVAIPIGSGPFQFVSFQNGTYTLHSEAPSVNIPGLSSSGEKILFFAEILASTGFVVAVPDYLGFGVCDTMFHPYLDKESTLRSVQDMLLATKELVNSENLDIATNNDLYIAGYSMGGWATMNLKHSIETGSLDGFNLKATACGAGPYDLFFVNYYILNQETYPMPYFLGYMLNSYTKLGNFSNPMTDIINEPYASRIPTLYNGLNDGAAINSQLTTDISELFTESFLDGFNTDPAYSGVKASLVENSIDPWAISTPLLLMHGDEDTFVPYQVTRNMYDEMKDLGVGDDKIELVSFPGSNHQDGIMPFALASIQWFLDKR